MIRRLAPAIAIAGLVLAACGSSGDDATADPAPTRPSLSTIDPGSDAEAPDEPSSTPTAPAGSSPADEPAVTGSGVVPENVPAALQFGAPLIGGGDIELTTLAGRPVLLWFWAPW